MKKQTQKEKKNKGNHERKVHYLQRSNKCPRIFSSEIMEAKDK